MHAATFEKLLQHLKTARQRAVFLLAPTTAAAQQAFLQELPQRLPHHLWLSDSPAIATQAAMDRYRDHLGATHSQVVLEFHRHVHADALAALSGTVAGGGCLWLLLPPYQTPFTERLLNAASDFALVNVATTLEELAQQLRRLTQLALPEAAQPSLPSDAQATIIEAMASNMTATHVLLADRGRGKSTTLGRAIVTTFRATELPIWVTGPHPRAVQTLLHEAQGKALFRAWDKLLSEPENFGQRLLIDEAAALPLHVLRELVQRYDVWALATTVDGYEGCGKGFAVRFFTELQQQTKVIRHELREPLRWCAADSAEAWLNQLLLLKPQPLPKFALTSSQLSWRHCSAAELDEDGLSQVMALLLEAHYQSSPNDLRLLLDDPAQQLIIGQQHADIVAVCWAAIEGPLEPALATQVCQGERRLKGQLLPQALGFYRQQFACTQWRWLRIVRIATLPALQRQGLASTLLDTVATQALAQGIDALGTSFGATPELNTFWRKNSFLELRRGQKRNASSGAVNTLWARPLQPHTQPLIATLAQLQQAEQQWYEHQTLATPTPCLTQQAKALLKGFRAGHLPFSNVRFAWVYLYAVKQLPLTNIQADIAQPERVLAEVAQAHRFSSRGAFENWLRDQAQALC